MRWIPRDLEFDQADLWLPGLPAWWYDGAPDGLWFYVRQSRTPPPAPVVTHINLVMNWFEG